ncbi:MAG: hypothetical protein H0X65_05920 [Gemmatimonadetes bacterium]|nr:hypothetical protein [Gemmatimonadota bacterium]
MSEAGATVCPHSAPEPPRRWGAVLLTIGAGLVSLPLFYPPFFPFTLGLLPIVVPTVQFALTPLWQLAGVYRYYSPILFVTEARNGVYELHGGTSFDYLRLYRRGVPAPAHRVLLREYLAGLLGLIRDVEEGRVAPDARIVGTSYFFSDRTARKLGFSLSPAPTGVKLHLMLDMLSVALMYSYAHGRLVIPPVWRARTAETTAAELARRGPVVERLLHHLAGHEPVRSPRRG